MEFIAVLLAGALTLIVHALHRARHARDAARVHAAAHELNNLLTVVRGHADLARVSPGEVDEHLEAVAHAAEAAQAVVDELECRQASPPAEPSPRRRTLPLSGEGPPTFADDHRPEAR